MSSKIDRIRAVLIASEPECRLCARSGAHVPAVTVGMIIPRVQGGRIERANLQPVCARHVTAEATKSPALVRIMRKRLRERKMMLKQREL